MKVSIITSCFNRQNTIREAIESVLAQDYPNIEYIIYWNKDVTIMVIKGFSKSSSVRETAKTE